MTEKQEVKVNFACPCGYRQDSITINIGDFFNCPKCNKAFTSIQTKVDLGAKRNG